MSAPAGAAGDGVACGVAALSAPIDCGATGRASALSLGCWDLTADVSGRALAPCKTSLARSAATFCAGVSSSGVA